MKSFTYDKANQLVTSTFDVKVTNYAYDAAKHPIQKSDKVNYKISCNTMQNNDLYQTPVTK